MVKALDGLGADMKAMDDHGNTAIELVMCAYEQGWARNRFPAYFAVEQYLRDRSDEKPWNKPLPESAEAPSCKPR